MILLGLQDYTPGFIVLISGYGGSMLVTIIWVKQVLTLSPLPQLQPQSQPQPQPEPQPQPQPQPLPLPLPLPPTL